MKESGQTLIEVLVALAAAVVVISAITAATVSSLHNAEFSRDQSQATQYAQQGIEIMRNVRDVNIASISATALPDSYTYCLADGCTGITSSSLTTSPYCGPSMGIQCSQNVNKFVREVTVNHTSTNCQYLTTGAMQVTVDVLWNDSTCTSTSNLFCHKVEVSTCLSNFTVVPSP